VDGSGGGWGGYNTECGGRVWVVSKGRVHNCNTLEIGPQSRRPCTVHRTSHDRDLRSPFGGLAPQIPGLLGRYLGGRALRQVGTQRARYQSSEPAVAGCALRGRRSCTFAHSNCTACSESWNWNQGTCPRQTGPEQGAIKFKMGHGSGWPPVPPNFGTPPEWEPTA